MSGQYIPKKTLKSSRNRNGRYVGLIFPATPEFFFICLHLEISKGIFSHEKMLLLEPLQTVCTCTEPACTCTEHTTPPNQPLAWTMIKTGALKHSKVFLHSKHFLGT